MATTTILELAQVAQEERRAGDRQPVSVPLTIHLVHHSVSLVAESASPSGLFITSEHAPPVGFGLHVTLALEDGPIEAVATVVRVVPGQGIGVRLTIPGEEQRARWARFLEAARARATQPPPTAWNTSDPRALFDFSWSNADGPEPM